ncbi:MAG: hypothetical protein ACI35R_12105 [Bacillus sp. (in: firmicutes)]
MEAAAIYYLAYNEELPIHHYTKADVQYIIEQCTQKLIDPAYDSLHSEIIH